MIYINNEEKVQRIKLEKNNCYIVADFDKTLTEGNSNSTWAVVANANELGEEYTNKRKELYNYYRPIEIDNSILDSEKTKFMSEWWKKHINLFYKYKLKEVSIIRALKNGGLRYREGAKVFLKKMHELGIPVIIISAGIGNVIEEFLKIEDDYYDNIKIISNFINFENGVIKNLKSEPIHALNKNIVRLDEKSKENLAERKNILLLGDGIADLRMISEEDRENAITVGFLEENIENRLEYFNRNFDITITNKGTFYDVNNILNIY